MKFLEKLVDVLFEVSIMRTTSSGDALKDLENQALTEMVKLEVVMIRSVFWLESVDRIYGLSDSHRGA